MDKGKDFCLLKNRTGEKADFKKQSYSAHSGFVFYFLLDGVDGVESLATGLLLRLKMLTMGTVGCIA